MGGARHRRQDQPRGNEHRDQLDRIVSCTQSYGMDEVFDLHVVVTGHCTMNESGVERQVDNHNDTQQCQNHGGDNLDGGGSVVHSAAYGSEDEHEQRVIHQRIHPGTGHRAGGVADGVNAAALRQGDEDNL